MVRKTEIFDLNFDGSRKVWKRYFVFFVRNSYENTVLPNFTIHITEIKRYYGNDVELDYIRLENQKITPGFNKNTFTIYK